MLEFTLTLYLLTDPYLSSLFPSAYYLYFVYLYTMLVGSLCDSGSTHSVGFQEYNYL